MIAPARSRGSADPADPASDLARSAPGGEARTASAVVWDWRRAEGASPGARAREASAARRRGVLQGAVGLAAAAVYLLWRSPVAWLIAGIALALTLVALASPLGWHRRVQRALAAFGHGVGLAVTWVLMTALFYLLFLPAGLVLRARGRLGITTSFDRRLPSYWTRARGERPPETYRKQF